MAQGGQRAHPPQTLPQHQMCIWTVQGEANMYYPYPSSPVGRQGRREILRSSISAADTNQVPPSSPQLGLSQHKMLRYSMLAALHLPKFLD